MSLSSMLVTAPSVVWVLLTFCALMVHHRDMNKVDPEIEKQKERHALNLKILSEQII